MYGGPGYPPGAPQSMHRNLQSIEGSGAPSQEFAGKILEILAELLLSTSFSLETVN